MKRLRVICKKCGNHFDKDAGDGSKLCADCWYNARKVTAKKNKENAEKKAPFKIIPPLTPTQKNKSSNAKSPQQTKEALMKKNREIAELNEMIKELTQKNIVQREEIAVLNLHIRKITKQ